MQFRVAALSVFLSKGFASASSPNNGGGGGGYYGNNYGQSQQQIQPQKYYGQPDERQSGQYGEQQGQGMQQQNYADYQNQDQQQEQEQQKEKEEEAPAAEEEELPPLPEGWAEYIDPNSGRPYYYHAADGVTTWTRPVAPAPPVEDIAGEEEESSGEEFVPNKEEPLDEGKSTEELVQEEQEQTFDQYYQAPVDKPVDDNAQYRDETQQDPYMGGEESLAVKEVTSEQQQYQQKNEWDAPQQQGKWGMQEQQWGKPESEEPKQAPPQQSWGSQ